MNNPGDYKIENITHISCASLTWNTVVVCFILPSTGHATSFSPAANHEPAVASDGRWLKSL